MNPERFAEQLPRLFDEFPASEHPRERRFDDVLESVPNLATENTLALLNLAASLRDPGESYVEVGTYGGASLIAAMRGNEGDFVGIDDFRFRDGSREALRRNLARFGAEDAAILEGDAFELVPEGALAGRSVGVYYYDASHEYEAQLEGLRMIEPHLADRALLVVDDSDWEQVARATADYLAGRPQARLLLEIPGKDRGLPQWWEGMQVLAWEA